MSRYYLIASLPMLSLEHKPNITAEAFLASCRAQLGEADADAAEALMSGAPSGHPFVVAWRDKDTLLCNAAARARARAKGTDATRWVRPAQGCDVRLERLVEEAFQQPDPILRERALDQARWRVVEDLQGHDPMGTPVALAYAVKLALALRWAALDAGRGRAVFDDLTRLPEGLITL